MIKIDCKVDLISKCLFITQRVVVMEGHSVSEVLRIYVALAIACGLRSNASTCNDLNMAASGLLPNGSYIVNNDNGESFKIFCQFYSGYGYAFISNSTDLDIDVSSLMDDPSHVVIRHKRVDGHQFTSTIEQLDTYAREPILVQFNTHHGSDTLSNIQMTPYLFVRFIPESLIAAGEVNGWKVNGNELIFSNCDGNRNSYFALLYDHSMNGYTRIGEGFNEFMFSWYSSASQVQSTEDLPDEFFTSQYEIHHGGCGGFATSNAVSDIAGVAVGVKFLITCAPPDDITGGTTFYTDTRVGNVVTYTCFEGYVMVKGNSSRTCVENGSWLGIIPTCKELSNVALGKQAYQTDTYCCGPGDAGLAVDGELSQFWNDGSCSRTETKAEAYWEVDLGDVYIIDHITVFGRIDPCCDDHLRQVEVYTGVTQSSYILAAFHDAAINNVQTVEMSQAHHARWVKITRLSAVDEELSLCEVQVMGNKLNSMLYKTDADTKGTGNVISTYSSLSKIDCCRKCFRTSGCVAVNLDLSNQVCYLLDSEVQTTSTDHNMVFYAADFLTT